MASPITLMNPVDKFIRACAQTACQKLFTMHDKEIHAITYVTLKKIR